MTPTKQGPGRSPRRRSFLAVLVLLAVGALLVAARAPEPPPPDPEPVAAPAPPPPPPTTTTTAPSVPVVCQTAAHSTESEPVPTEAAPVDYVAVTEAADGEHAVHTFSATSPADRANQVAAISNTGAVLSVDRDAPVHALDVAPTSLPAIDDPVYVGPPSSTFGPQWQIDAVGYQAAWGSSLNQGAGIHVGVIDTGVQANHPDLTGGVVAGADFVGGSGSSVGDGDTDPNGHGTHVAGIVGAHDNAIGGIGGAPQVTIVPVRVLGSTGGGSTSDVVSGILWAADPTKGHVQVINMSLGTTSCTQAMYDALTYAVSHGVVVVASSGELQLLDGTALPGPRFAPQIPGFLAVAATTQGNGHASYSDVAPYVSISSPGGGGTPTTGIWSTAPPNTVKNPTSDLYLSLSGTSMASPGVTAAAALVKAKCSAYSPAQVANRLVSTAQDLGASGSDSTFGAGLVRADLAVVAAC